ncbi:MAG: hypothetical protein FWC50_06575 [Planctomycetaceae bacterium]|nr:hypothetical protein [Planctomycetaceae bacterium]
MQLKLDADKLIHIVNVSQRCQQKCDDDVRLCFFNRFRNIEQFFEFGAFHLFFDGKPFNRRVNGLLQPGNVIAE